MKIPYPKFLRHTVAVTPAHAIGLFVLLQVYFASNLLSFGFWKSGEGVFEYMLLFFGAWLVGLVLLLWLFLATGRRLSAAWLPLAVLVVLSVPFAWEVWIRSMEIDSSAMRKTLRVLLFAVMYLYFRIGLQRFRETTGALLLLCVLSFAGHAGFSLPTGASRDFDTVGLEKTPNIHVIMLDSLTHSPFSREFMGVENPAADYLATLDDAIYAGYLGFVETTPTAYSWSTLFNLGQESRNTAAFSGSSPSRLTVLLRRNGYNITTGFSNEFFGWRKGEFVDHYHTGKAQELKYDLVCVNPYGKLRFCSEFSQSVFSRFFVTELEDENKREERTNEWPDAVLDLIDRAERSATGPIFSGFYIYSPIGHASWDFRKDDAEALARYKRQFVEGVQRARQVIEDIDRLRRRYPDSIFIVSGDHGPFLSKYSRRHGREKDRRFFVLGQHSVAVALLNASNLCPWSRDWLDRQRYLTPSRMLVASLACDGDGRRLTEYFTDNEEFVRLGNSYATGGTRSPD